MLRRFLSKICKEFLKTNKPLRYKKKIIQMMRYVQKLTIYLENKLGEDIIIIFAEPTQKVNKKHFTIKNSIHMKYRIIYTFYYFNVYKSSYFFLFN